MPSEIDRSLFRLTVFASAHSQQFGLSGYSLERLSNEQIIDIGSAINRVFEERYEEEIKKAPPGTPGAPDEPAGGARLRQRKRQHIQ